MLGLTAAIILSVAAGVWSHGRDEERTRRLIKRALDAMLYVALPFITFFVLARLHVDTGVGVGLAFAYTELAIVGLLAWFLARKVFDLSTTTTAAMVVCVVMANTGYLGVPLNRALLGSHELGPAITFDAVVSGPMFYVFGFAIAAAFTTKDAPWRERIKTFVTRNPPLIAVVAAMIAPDALAPDVMVDIAKAAVFGLLPVGFFILGATLAAEGDDGALAFPPPINGPIASVVLLRMALAPALMAAMAIAVDVPDAYLLQAAMPVGINSIIVAHAYDLDLRLTSAAVAWSTTIAVIAGLATVPF